MNTRHHIQMAGAAAMLLLSACVKDTLYKTPHPDKCVVVVTADWSGRSSDAPVPESWELQINPAAPAALAERSTRSGEISEAKVVMIPPGEVRMLAYNRPEGIVIDGAIATVESNADGAILAKPGYIFSSGMNQVMPSDDTVRVNINMNQHSQNLQLGMQVSSGNVENVAAIEGVLTGVAASVDLTTGMVIDRVGHITSPDFVINTSGAGSPTIETSLNLLGVVSSGRQELSLTVVMKNGCTTTLTSDLTDLLKGFGQSDKEPLKLTTAIDLPVNASTEGTITDWVSGNGDGEEVDVH